MTDVTGTVGGQHFRIEFQGTLETPVRTADLAASVHSKLERLQQVPTDAAPRVFSAHRYLLQARRLRYASAYPSQFLGERLLNLYKVVEILFGRDVDDLRASLTSLGLKAEVTELLVGLVYVRDETDVGHPAIHVLDRESYETVHRYAESVEDIVTWLLDHILDRAASGSFQFKPVRKSASKRTQTLATVAQGVLRVNALQPETFLVGPNSTCR